MTNHAPAAATTTPVIIHPIPSITSILENGRR
jgi:hypothetical protein